MGGGTCIRGRARRQTRYSSPERAPRLFHPLVLSRPRVLPFCTPIRPSHWQIPVLFQRSSNPSRPPPDRPDACQISPPILPQFHRCIGGLGPTTSTSDHRLLDNAGILLICLQAASDSYLSYSYFTTPMPSLAKSCSQRPTAPTRPARLLGPFPASCLHLFRPQAPPLKSVLELNFYDIITLTASMAPRWGVAE